MIALLLVLSLSSADPQSPELVEARRHFDDGRAQYDLGRFEAALSSFERAWQAKPLPAFLFNIGQCHFQAQRFDRAQFFYERYLELEPGAANRVVVEELIAEARSRQGLPPQLAPASRAGRTPDATPTATAPSGERPSWSGSSSRARTAEVADGADGGDADGDVDVPWLWIGIGGATAALVGGAVLVLMLNPQQPASGSLGTLDGRGN